MKRIQGWKAGVAVALLAATASPGYGQRHEDRGKGLVDGVVRIESATPRPNAKAVGISVPTALMSGFGQIAVATGNTVLDGGTATIPYYGYYGNGPMYPAPGDVQSSTHNVEATKSEPDKNTYLVLTNQNGPSAVDYGTHFVYQGHELGPTDSASGLPQSYITRINLDADAAHRVTLMAYQDTNGKPLPPIDGSTWDPWAQRLLFTYESGSAGGVWQATLDYPSTVEDLRGILGTGGYEGIQNDSDGNLWIVEDIGGSAGATNKNSKQPNSFVYRFIPNDKTDLKKGGRLQALQVMGPSGPIVFHAGQADADILSSDRKALHTYGQQFTTTWITIHDTAVDGSTSGWNSNALAKSKNATPFKRPENGVFRPGTNFTQFFFTETGDTTLTTEAASAYGGFGGIYRLNQASPSAASGIISVFYVGDQAHTGLDNITFYDADHLIAVEDAGDGLHTARNLLDSGYLFDATADYSDIYGAPPLRFLAEGRDPSATIDSAYSAAGNGFQNEGDNEITGIHMSDGDPTTNGILGAKIPTPYQNGWRLFYTAQHGDNVTWEIVRTKPATTPDFSLF